MKEKLPNSLDEALDLFKAKFAGQIKDVITRAEAERVISKYIYHLQNIGAINWPLPEVEIHCRDEDDPRWLTVDINFPPKYRHAELQTTSYRREESQA